MGIDADGSRGAFACLKKADSVATWSKERAVSAIVGALSSSCRGMTGEEIVDACVEQGIKPHDQRAFGPLFSRLSRSGVIRCVGYAPRAKGHGTAGARVWELVR